MVHSRPIRRRRVVVAAVALFAVSTSLLGTSPAHAADPGPGTGLTALMADVVDASVPGIIVRVQDGEQVRLAAAGVADLTTGTRLRPQARFRVGSVTKSMVAVVVLQLDQERRLSLDQPVGRVLPGLLMDGNRITVRELLNHTSGLFDYTQDPAVLAGIARDQVFTPAELVAIAEQHPATAAPGTAWAYSNTDYIVAGMLVEAVTHHRLGTELRERIFGPLRLKDTSFPRTGRITGYYAHGYLPAGLVPTADGGPFDATGLNPSSAWAAGGVVSTAKDLAHFYQALMGGRLLGPRLMREMKTTVAEDPADPDHFRYGLGIERVQDVCGANWGHGGSIFGYQDLAYWNEQTGRTVVIASTMFPPPPAAEASLDQVTDVAICHLPTVGR